MSFVRHIDYTVAELQALLDIAEPGSRVTFPRGVFTSPRRAVELQIRKPLWVDGAGAAVCFNPQQKMVPTGTTLICLLVVTDEVEGALVRLSNFQSLAPVRLHSSRLERMVLSKVKIDCMLGRTANRPDVDCANVDANVDALELHGVCSRRKNQARRTDRVLLEDCEVLGGSDGVFINSADCTLRRCRITGAHHRGIFANQEFTIEDSTVEECGGYGMKMRSGCKQLGRNTIQDGPWDEMTAGFGLYGME